MNVPSRPSPLIVKFSTSATTSSSDNTAGKIHHHRIFRHPYIDSANKDNNIWTDPQTGLDYQTDLTQYLNLINQNTDVIH
jgi:hypothetical protein